MAEKRDRSLTYLEAAEFARLGERVYGFGWQQTFAKQTGYNRVQIGRYATGVEPIPPHMASLIKSLAALLDLGVAPDLPEPVGRVIEGKFAKV